jgi:hypothetical protein
VIIVIDKKLLAVAVVVAMFAASVPASAITVTYTVNATYMRVVFTGTAGSAYWVCPQNVTNVSLLLVGGGGGGGQNGGGGGGAGGFNETPYFATTPWQNYTLTIGANGAGGTATAAATNGGNTSFGLTSVPIGSRFWVSGGGAGGGNRTTTTTGGSGGGGGNLSYSGMPGNNAGYGIPEGTAGGNALLGYGGGGGGGAAVAGTTSTTTLCGNGGNGKTSTLSGATVYYSGGGGAGGTSTMTGGGTAGLGGGGAGSRTANGAAATANTGGGGGGGAYKFLGGNGAVGFAVIQYPILNVSTSCPTCPTTTDSAPPNNTLVYIGIALGTVALIYLQRRFRNERH